MRRQGRRADSGSAAVPFDVSSRCGWNAKFRTVCNENVKRIAVALRPDAPIAKPKAIERVQAALRDYTTKLTPTRSHKK
jgi:hypothetical protein